MEKTTVLELPILVVDDEEMWLHSISLTLEKYGGFKKIITCRDSRKVMDIISKNKIGLILLDLVMPHFSGEQLLSMIGEAHPEIPVIIITGLNQVEVGIKCMKQGAFDFFVKTVGKDELLASVQRALRMLEMRNINERLTSHFLSGSVRQPELFAEIITQDQRMQSIFRYIEAIAKSAHPLLITGESGTGKELIATVAHRASCPDKPFVSINVAGLDDNVFSDTLFGHIQGAFTGADQNRQGIIKKAGQGVVFLDEVGDLSLASQVKLLRILQEGEFFPIGSDEPRKTRARFFFATNKDIEHQVKIGTFRKDLYYRMRTHHVHLPPLRERTGDVALLLNHYIHKAAASMGIKAPRYGEGLIPLLESYSFPGNIRELSSIVYDAVAQNNNDKLSNETIRQALGHNPVEAAYASSQGRSTSGKWVSFSKSLPTIRLVDQLLIKEAMRRSNGNQTIAAGMLGISQPSLSRRLKMIRDEET